MFGQTFIPPRKYVDADRSTPRPGWTAGGHPELDNFDRPLDQVVSSGLYNHVPLQSISNYTGIKKIPARYFTTQHKLAPVLPHASPAVDRLFESRQANGYHKSLYVMGR